MDVSLDSSIPTGVCLVPPVVSTPVLGVARDPPNVSVSPLPCEEVQSENEVDSTCVGDDEGGFVDMQVSNTTEDTPSEYMSTVCQSLAKLLGHSVQLLEFDQIRTSLKNQTIKLPSELHKHKKLAWCFRKQVCRHKAHLEELLTETFQSLQCQDSILMT